MSTQPLIPASLWLALAVAAMLLLGWYALRRPEMLSRPRWAGVVALMGVAIALALLILLNPIRVRQIPPPPGKPLLTVLVDASASMATPDAAAGSTRYANASAVGVELASRLNDQFDVRVRTFSGLTTTSEAADLASRKADGLTTDIGQAIADNLADDRPQGQAVVVLSDGIANVDGGVGTPTDLVLDAVRRAKGLDVPVYTRTFGGSTGTMDLAVGIRSSQELAAIGQRVPVNVQVTQIGAKGVHAIVSLNYNGKEVEKQDVVMTGDTADVRFWATQDKVGLYPYEARVEPVPGERTIANNSATFLLRVIDQPIRVLALEGKPYWDSKFLVRTLASAPAVELDSIVRIADGRFMQRTVTRRHEATARPSAGPAAAGAPMAAAPASSTPAPTSTDSETWQILSNANEILSDPALLRKYQIVVLGRDSEAFLTEDTLTNLQNWILKDGGSLVCYRGEPVAQVNQRLARLLPVKWTASHEARFRMRLTDRGRDMHWFGGSGADEDNALLGLPTLASTAQVDRSKPAAVVLATSVAPGGGESPAVIYQPYGLGRAVVIEGAGMWRWAFLPPQFQQREEVYSELWHSLLRWLSSGVQLQPGQNLALNADKVRFSTIESATASLLVREEGAKVAIQSVELIGPSPAERRTFTPTPLGDDPGVFRVDFGKLPEGRYQAHVLVTGELRLNGANTYTGAINVRADESTADSGDVATRTVFDVRAISQEQIDLDVRPDLMARIAAESGGTVLGNDPADELAAAFRAHVQLSRPPKYERTTAWDRPWALLAVFVMWSLSWVVRRSGGLV